jgi:hypothetical protein
MTGDERLGDATVVCGQRKAVGFDDRHESGQRIQVAHRGQPVNNEFTKTSSIDIFTKV